jgi:hypothetical protein
MEGKTMQLSKALADWTEADEAAHTKDVALANLQFQIEQEETMGVIGMYELAAQRAGATASEINAARERGKTWARNAAQ